jgi:ribosomal protein S11
MALTPDVIKANETLATLNDAQVAAIATLSVNDENIVINSKIGKMHERFETDVLEIVGEKKKEGEQSFDLIKRVLTDFKSKVGGASELTTKITGYETEIANLKKQISEGKGDEVIRQQLTDAQSQLSALKTQYDTDKQTWGSKEKEFSQQITGIQVDTQFEKVTAGLKFKAGYPESVQKTLLSSAKAAILGTYKPDWIEADGQKIMVFRDAKGEIARNKANSLNPFTAQELIQEQLKDVIDLGQKKVGTGTGDPGKGQTDAIELVDIAGAKTQVQADEIIVKYLMQLGETRGSASFSDKQKKLREDNGVNKLPLR